MTLKFKVTIVRHGETDLNVQRCCQGHTDTLLNDNGCKQALHTGKNLSDEKFSHIFCSDLSRAKKTCELILSQNVHYSKKNKEITFDKRIRERGFGVFEGKSVVEYYELAEKTNISWSEFTPEGAETSQTVTTRAHLFLKDLFDQIYNENKDGKTAEDHCANILIVTHGGFVKYFMNVLEDNYGCVNDNRNVIMVNCARTVLLCTVADDSETVQFSNNATPQNSSHTTLVKCLLFNEFY